MLTYTAESIREYHNLTDATSIKEALATLEAIERRELEERDLADLTDTQAREIGTEAAIAAADRALEASRPRMTMRAEKCQQIRIADP